MHHQELEPARAVLLVDLDTELMARGALARFALQLAAQAEGCTRAGLADKTLPLSEIGPEIVKRVRWGR